MQNWQIYLWNHRVNTTPDFLHRKYSWANQDKTTFRMSRRVSLLVLQKGYLRDCWRNTTFPTSHVSKCHKYSLFLPKTKPCIPSFTTNLVCKTENVYATSRGGKYRYCFGNGFLKWNLKCKHTWRELNHIDSHGLMRIRRKPSALATELRAFWIDPSIPKFTYWCLKG